MGALDRRRGAEQCLLRAALEHEALPKHQRLGDDVVANLDAHVVVVLAAAAAAAAAAAFVRGRGRLLDGARLHEQPVEGRQVAAVGGGAQLREQVSDAVFGAAANERTQLSHLLRVLEPRRQRLLQRLLQQRGLLRRERRRHFHGCPLPPLQLRREVARAPHLRLLVQAQRLRLDEQGVERVQVLRLERRLEAARELALDEELPRERMRLPKRVVVGGGHAAERRGGLERRGEHALVARADGGAQAVGDVGAVVEARRQRARGDEHRLGGVDLRVAARARRAARRCDGLERRLDLLAAAQLHRALQVRQRQLHRLPAPK